MSAYGLAAAFLCVSGLIFGDALVVGREASLRLWIDPVTFVLVLVTPLVTARSFAEERRSGSAELLFTLPIGPGWVVLAKYLSALVLLCSILAATAVDPLLLALLGHPDWGPIVSQYLGAVLVLAAFSAMGITVSLLSASQVLVAAVGVAVSLAVWFLGDLTDSFGGTLSHLIAAVTPSKHLAGFEQGIVDVRDVLFFVAFAALWLGLGTQLARAEGVRR